MPNLISKADLARIAGVSRQAITLACTTKFPAAVYGNQVDADHPDVVRYVEWRQRMGLREVERAIAPAPARPPTSPPEAAGSTPVPATEKPAIRPAASASAPAERLEADESAEPHGSSIADDIARYGDISLNALLSKFSGGVDLGDAANAERAFGRFVRWLEARKRMSEIREKDLKNEEKTKKLIPREFVATHVFAFIDSVLKKLLQDTAPTIARRIHEAARAGVAVEQCEQISRDLIGKALRDLKNDSIAGLREMKKDQAA